MENNELIENDLPPYLIGDSDIDPKFVNNQKIYDSLYLDDGKEFKHLNGWHGGNFRNSLPGEPIVDIHDFD